MTNPGSRGRDVLGKERMTAAVDSFIASSEMAAARGALASSCEGFEHDNMCIYIYISIYIYIDIYIYI